MSRAFVKENDLEHAGIDVPERPISSEKNYVTPNGLIELEEKISNLESSKEKKSSLSNDYKQSKKKCNWNVIYDILLNVLNQQF